MNRLPRWRLAAGCLVLAVLVFLLVLFTPVYLRNLRLQNYVDGITRAAGSSAQSDAVLRDLVLQKAHSLELPVTEDNVQISRSSDGLRIEVRYAVRVRAGFYQVDLHFYPGAGSR